MKRILFLTLIVLSFIGCNNGNRKQDGICANSIIIDSVEVPPYGILSPELQRDDIKYRICPTSVVVGIIFSETVIAPVYLAGWELYEPIGKK
jgi:hypothetical protein